MKKLEGLGSEAYFSFLLNSSKGANSRKKILEKLLSGSKSCNQIATALGLNWRTAYRHLQLLEKEHLIKNFAFGQRKIYKLTLIGEAAIQCYIKSTIAPPIKTQVDKASDPLRMKTSSSIMGLQTST